MKKRCLKTILAELPFDRGSVECITHAGHSIAFNGGSRISERGGGQGRGTEGTEGVRCGEGVSPSPLGEESGEGVQEIFFIFHLKIVSFSALWGVFYHSSAALFIAKTVFLASRTCK